MFRIIFLPKAQFMWISILSLFPLSKISPRWKRYSYSKSFNNKFSLYLWAQVRPVQCTAPNLLSSFIHFPLLFRNISVKTDLFFIITYLPESFCAQKILLFFLSGHSTLQYLNIVQILYIRLYCRVVWF